MSDNQDLANGLMNFGRSAFRAGMQPINTPMDVIGAASRKFGWGNGNLPGTTQWTRQEAGPTNLDETSGKLGGIMGAAIPALLMGGQTNIMSGLLGLGLMMAKDKFLK